MEAFVQLFAHGPRCCLDIVGNDSEIGCGAESPDSYVVGHQFAEPGLGTVVLPRLISSTTVCLTSIPGSTSPVNLPGSLIQHPQSYCCSSCCGSTNERR
jgi:hypothetical protein